MPKIPINRIICGDSLEVLRTLPDGCIQCVVTSPPYWGLRDYGVSGQIGLEASPEEYVSKMVEIFREVRRVLRKDGTLWLNLGSSYAASGRNKGNGGSGPNSQKQKTNRGAYFKSDLNGVIPDGLKPKDLLGIPWMVAFALQADGWYLRQDIIWSKPNPMPESCKDRCTKSHEYLFLLSRGPRYFYDAEAIKEPCVQDEFANGFRGGAYCENATFDNSEGGKRKTRGNQSWSSAALGHPQSDSHGGVGEKSPFRNRRSVWTIATAQCKENHFATFPEKLVEPCILAGSRPGDIVLDPFMGSGTVALVAHRLRRNHLGIELNPEYVAMAEERLAPHLAQMRF